MDTLQQKVKMIQELKEKYDKQELHNKIITKTDNLFLEIEKSCSGSDVMPAGKWLALYDKAFQLVVLFPDIIKPDQFDYSNYLFNRIVEFCKDKDDKSKAAIYRLFAYFWRLHPKLSKEMANN